MDNGLDEKWAAMEKELRVAMEKLSDAIERARSEIPDAARAINEEYLRMQAKLDEAVSNLRK